MPLYRQHRRLQAAGFRVSRQWLTQLVQLAVGLLEPIYDAQVAGMLMDRVKAMDETPIKAGVTGAGKMKDRLLLAGVRAERRGVFPLPPGPGGDERCRCLGLEAAGRRGAAHGRLRSLCAVRAQGRVDARPMLGSHEESLLRGPGAWSRSAPSTRCG